MNHPPIEALRETLDAIDAEILQILERRVRIVLEIGRIKAEDGLAIHDRQREERILERLRDLTPAPLDAIAIERIFTRVLQECRRLEHDATDEPEER